MINLFNQFKSLNQSAITTIVTIDQVNGDGTSTATTLNGVTVVVGGDSVAVGGKAYVRSGEITRAAPSVPFTDVAI